MRTIEFRGKRAYGNEKWVYGDLIQYGRHKSIRVLIDDSKFPIYEEFIVIPETVGQFTGLTDKNGNKIFEGDVLEGKYKNRGVMEWDEKDACFSRFYPLIDFEVIGNIHDNPELI